MARSGFLTGKAVAPIVTGILLAALVTGAAWRGGGFGFAGIDVTGFAAPAAIDGSLLLVREDDDGSVELIAVRLADGETVASVRLDRRPHRVVPTPGGVSAFVLWPESNAVTVFNTETLEIQRELELDAVRHATELSFSPTGERVYVVDSAGSEVVEYRHVRLELTESRRLELAGSGPVLTNRRATRLYRVGQDAVHAYFAQTGDLVETYPVHIDGGMRFDAQYTALWGVAAAGDPVAIDERTGQVRTPATGAVARGVPAAGDRVAYLATDRRSVHLIDPREPTRVEATVDLPAAADYLVARGPTDLWAVTADGAIVSIAGGRARPVRDAHTAGITDAVVARIDRAGSFACF